MASIPEKIPRHIVVVVGTADRPKWTVFDCPCSAGHLVTLNLSHGHWPCWRLTVSKGRPTIWPSVDVRASVRCHYFVTQGRVAVVSDLLDGPSPDTETGP
jgi:hypothetical protein